MIIRIVFKNQKYVPRKKGGKNQKLTCNDDR